MSASKKTLLIIFIIVHTIMQTNGIDKYTDENRPYEFGFNIEGEQHRHEKKDENGIIMGEFGFITADGVYHVTVYATDEQGRFKILSMKNIRVKPYPTARTQNSRTGHSLSIPGLEKNTPSSSDPISNPVKDLNKQDIAEVHHTQLPLRQPASPVKSCSHCSLPTTTTLAPLLPQGFDMQTNSGNADILSANIENHSIYDNNQRVLNNKNPYKQSNTAISASSDVPSSTDNNNGQGKPLQGISGTSELENYNKNNYGNAQTNDAYHFNNGENNQKMLHPEFTVRIPSMEDTFTNVSPYITNKGSSGNEQNNPQPGANAYEKPQNQEINSTGFGLTGLDQYSQKMLQSSSYKPLDKTYPENVGYDMNQSNVLGNRSPKKFEPSSNNVGPYNTNMNVAPRNSFGSLESSNTGPKNPMLISAQMQIVNKNTDIYHKNPGERDGLPEGVTENYVERVLYVFNYTVGFHGHYEKGYENGAKQGYYYVTGRNGVRTRVDYEADEKGFRPKISQEILDILSEEVPKPETEKEQKYGLKSYEFKWLYFPIESQQKK